MDLPCPLILLVVTNSSTSNYFGTAAGAQHFLAELCLNCLVLPAFSPYPAMRPWAWLMTVERLVGGLGSSSH